MSRIAHARRLSSPAASSRRAVDAVVVGNRVPIGIPPCSLPSSSRVVVLRSRF